MQGVLRILQDVIINILYLLWICGIFIVPAMNVFGSLSVNVPIVRDTIVTSVFTGEDRAIALFVSSLGLIAWVLSGTYWMRQTAFSIPREAIGANLLNLVRTVYIIGAALPILGVAWSIRGVSANAALDPGAPIEDSTLRLIYYILAFLFPLYLIISNEIFCANCTVKIKRDALTRWRTHSGRRNAAIFFTALFILLTWGVYPSLPSILKAPLLLQFLLAMVVWTSFIAGFPFAVNYLTPSCFKEVCNSLRRRIQNGHTSDLEGEYSGIFTSPPLYSLIVTVFFVSIFWTYDSYGDVKYSGLAQTLEMRQNSGNSSPRDNLDVHLRNWLNERYPDGLKPGTKVPLIFISASGGGLRAAIWTSSVLNQLSERDPLFVSNVWSASGVSGGSIGLASYFAAIQTEKDTLKISKRRSCRVTTVNGLAVSEQPISECLFAFFKADALSPVLGAALFRDPLPFYGSSDRTSILFDAWQTNWESWLLGPELGQRMEGFSPRGINTGPVLLFNSTVVEIGRRFIISNVELDPQDFDFHFVKDEVGGMSPRLIEAAGVSALFPYISNAFPIYMPCKEILDKVANSYGKWHSETCANLEGDRSVLWGHLVDGGYFENLGARTTLNIYEATMRAWARLNIDAVPVPIVIQITNDPNFGEFPFSGNRQYLSDMAPWPGTRSSPFTPADALFSTMSAHEQIELEDFAARHMTAHNSEVEDQHWPELFHIGLCSTEDSGDVPLTWYLSETYVKDLLSTNRFTDCEKPEVALRRIIIKLKKIR